MKSKKTDLQQDTEVDTVVVRVVKSLSTGSEVLRESGETDLALYLLSGD